LLAVDQQPATGFFGSRGLGGALWEVKSKIDRNSEFGYDVNNCREASKLLKTKKNTQRLFAGFLLASMAACGSGSGGGPAPPPISSNSVGGTVSGITAGASVVLTDNSGDALTIHADGAFTFATHLNSGLAYAVAVGTDPSGEKCAVKNGSGTISGSDVTNVEVTCLVPSLQLVAGGLGGSGNADGDLATARFDNPEDSGYDAAGNLYVADDYNRTIRMIDPSGNVTTLAGSAGQDGTTDGTGAAARFANPVSIAVDPSGIVYVADAGVNTIRKISAGGIVTTLAGTPNMSGTADGTGAAAQFASVSSIRFGASGTLYLTDLDRIRAITPQGVVTTVYTGVTLLSGLAIDAQGNGYVADIDKKAMVKIDLSTGTLTGTVASGFENPVGIGIAPAGTAAAGTVYLSDEFAPAVYAVAPGGTVTTLAGNPPTFGSVDGSGSAALFGLPTFISMEPSGTFLVADPSNNEIRQVTAAGVVTTIAGVAPQTGEVNGTGAAARFANPEALSVDSAGNLYVADSFAIRKVTPSGVVTPAYTPGGVTGFALDASGNMYYSQPGLNSIYKIGVSGSSVLFAGSGTTAPGSSDGTGSSAGFNRPNGVAIDAAGNIFVADTLNRTIRKITPGGAVTTLAGTTGISGTNDGNGAAAQFTSPFAIAIDSSGNLFVTDGNAIRQIATTGAVSTLAGSQTSGYSDGTGAAAQFNAPAGIAIGPSGSLLVSDCGNSVIRRVSSAGIVTTVAGIAAKAGVQPGPLPASLNLPVGLVYVGSTLYVNDANENSLLSISGIF
jgi:sugar lactone lactonase YvrE